MSCLLKGKHPHEYLMHDHFLVWNDGTLFWSLAKTERGFVTVSFWNFRQQDMHSSALCCCWEWEEGTAVYRSALSQPVNLPLPTFCQLLKSIEGKRATRYSCGATSLLLHRTSRKWVFSSFCFIFPHTKFFQTWEKVHFLIQQQLVVNFAETRDGLDSLGAWRHLVSPNHPSLQQNYHSQNEWGK